VHITQNDRKETVDTGATESAELAIMRPSKLLGLTSRDWTTRDRMARADIARPDNVAPDETSIISGQQSSARPYKVVRVVNRLFMISAQHYYVNVSHNNRRFRIPTEVGF